jgi:hypothetical protein
MNLGTTFHLNVNKASIIYLVDLNEPMIVTPQVLPKALAQYMHLWPIITCV